VKNKDIKVLFGTKISEVTFGFIKTSKLIRRGIKISALLKPT
jgi:hypothetical protein